MNANAAFEPNGRLAGSDFHALNEDAGKCASYLVKHMGGRPILFSSPGVQTHSFVPLTKTIMAPSAEISATVAFLGRVNTISGLRQ